MAVIIVPVREVSRIAALKLLSCIYAGIPEILSAVFQQLRRVLTSLLFFASGKGLLLQIESFWASIILLNQRNIHA